MKEKNLRKKNERNKVIIAVLLLIAIIGVGYATLGANLRINGVASIPSSTWNVHFKTGSISPTNGSVTIDTSNNEQAATITNATQVSYAVKLALPGDFYEFTVQVENTGSIDAMIDSVSSKLGTTEITTGTLPSYINYSVAYSDGTPIAAKQLLAANGGTETIKVRLEFKTDIEANQLPGEAATLNLNFQINYVQADSTATSVPHDIGTYTANFFDGDDTTINNGTNTSQVWIGQAIPNGITTYSTPALAMAALKQATGETTDIPFYLKHTISNNVVTESYVGFVISSDMVTQARNSYIANCNNDQTCIDGYQGMQAGTYYLKGKKTHEYVNNSWQCISEYDDGNGNCIDPDYNTNKATLLSAFGSSNCTDYSFNFYCEAGGLYSNAELNGSLGVEDGTWMCGVNNCGYSGCDNF